MNKSISIINSPSSNQAQINQLAQQLNLTILSTAQDLPEGALYLIFNQQRLELHEKNIHPTTPLYCDFLAPSLQYRLKHLTKRHELILRAIGKLTPEQKILDATAGFGIDAAILAAAKQSVLMLERSPLVHALLADGLKRLTAAQHPLANYLQLLAVDAHNFLETQAAQYRPAVIYLDPIYPDIEKTALNKRSMRLLRTIVGADQDADNLLTLANKIAPRVVVKRAKRAPFLNATPPNLQYSLGGSIRYDVYFNKF